MAGRIEKADLLAIQFHLVSADMLCNPAGFAGNDIGRPDGVKEAGFPMVDMPHNGDDRRAMFKFVAFAFDTFINMMMLKYSFFVKGNIFNFVAKISSQNDGRIEIKRMVDSGHSPLFHQHLNDFSGLYPHSFCQFTNGDTLTDANNALNCLGHGNFSFFLLFYRFSSPSLAVCPFGLEDLSFRRAMSPIFYQFKILSKIHDPKLLLFPRTAGLLGGAFFTGKFRFQSGSRRFGAFLLADFLGWDNFIRRLGTKFLGNFRCFFNGLFGSYANINMTQDFGLRLPRIWRFFWPQKLSCQRSLLCLSAVVSLSRISVS